MQSKVTVIHGTTRPTNAAIANDVREAADRVQGGIAALMGEIARNLEEAAGVAITLEGLVKLDPMLGSTLAELQSGLNKADMAMAAWQKRKGGA